MKYFAYGSNMSVTRLMQRVPSATPLGCHTLHAHDLRFHKAGSDGSGKCDAFYTDNREDTIFGALYEIHPAEIAALDEAEGLGKGYDKKDVTVFALNGAAVHCYTYIATAIDEGLSPYSWYLNHVLIGALETPLPPRYIDLKIRSVRSRQDRDKARDNQQRAMHL